VEAEGPQTHGPPRAGCPAAQHLRVHRIARVTAWEKKPIDGVIHQYPVIRQERGQPVADRHGPNAGLRLRRDEPPRCRAGYSHADRVAAS